MRARRRCRGGFARSSNAIAGPSTPLKALRSVEDQLQGFGRPYGAYRVCRGGDPRAAPSLCSGLPWAILDSSFRELRCPDGVSPLVELRRAGESPRVHGIPALRSDGPSVSDTLFHFRYFRHEKLQLPGSQHLALARSAVQSEHELLTRLDARACFKRPIPWGAQCPQHAIRTNRASCP